MPLDGDINEWLGGGPERGRPPRWISCAVVYDVLGTECGWLKTVGGHLIPIWENAEGRKFKFEIVLEKWCAGPFYIMVWLSDGENYTINLPHTGGEVPYSTSFVCELTVPW